MHLVEDLDQGIEQQVLVRLVELGVYAIRPARLAIGHRSDRLAHLRFGYTPFKLLDCLTCERAVA